MTMQFRLICLQLGSKYYLFEMCIVYILGATNTKDF
jgi:hypothetical protein